MRGSQAWAGLRPVVVLGCIVTAMVWAGVSAAAAPAGSEQTAQPAAGVPQPAPTLPATMSTNALGANARLLTDSEKSTFDAVLTSHQTLMTTLTWATGIVSSIIVLVAVFMGTIVGRNVSAIEDKIQSTLLEKSKDLSERMREIDKNIEQRVLSIAAEQAQAKHGAFNNLKTVAEELQKEVDDWKSRTSDYELVAQLSDS